MLTLKWKTRRDRARKIGDERVRTFFAWRPVAADDGYTYWMSTLVVREKLLPKIGRGGFVEDSEKWEIVQAEPVSGRKKK